MTNKQNITALALATVALYLVPSSGMANAIINPGVINNFINGGDPSGGIAQALCTVVGWFQGGVGQAIASLAVIFLGISAFFGKATWGTALTVTVGVFAIFGSAQIVNTIRSSASNSLININLPNIVSINGRTGTCQ